MQRAEIPDADIATLRSLYEEGRYLAAWEHAQSLPPMSSWTGADALVIAGRLLNNIEAPRLAHVLHTRAWRENRSHSEAAYYRALLLLRRFGPLRALRFLDAHGEFKDITAEQRANFLTARASALSVLRDFSRAEALLDEAAAIDGDRPWVWVERSFFLERADRYDDALKSVKKALSLQPWYRPAVQNAAHLLGLLSRDDEALALLREASAKLESASISAQLATLLAEREQHADALVALNRYRSLAVAIEPANLEWWHARMSDAHYKLGDLAAAAEHARGAKNGFHDKIAERLAAPPKDARVVRLPVPFVRQHEMTCAPATLSAICKYWNAPVDHLELARRICYDGTPGHEERNWADENGFVVREFRATWETAVALLDRGVPFTLATVETRSAHLQAIVGYDGIRGTLYIRDPYLKFHSEAIGEAWLSGYAFSGPRAMVLLPKSEAQKLDGIELPEAALYDHRFQLDRALHCHNREEAAKALASLEAAAPADRLTITARRELAWYDGSQPRALSATEELLKLFPDSNNLRWARYTSLRDLARNADRRAWLEELAKGKKPEPFFWRELGDELRADARQRNEARRWLLRALRAQPGDSENIHTYAGLLWDERRFVEATELYRYAACLRDKADYAQRSWFIAARYSRCAENVLAIFRKRVADDGTKSAQPAMTLHWALDALGRDTDANAILETALAQRPDDGVLLLFAADKFARQGQQERASQLLTHAEGKCTRTEWLRTAASINDYRGDLREALRLARLALGENPLDFNVQRNATRLIAEVEGRTAALAQLRDQVALFPFHLPLRRLLIEQLREDGPQASEPAIHDLLAIEPGDAWAMRELALVLSELGRFDEALTLCAAATALEPHEPNCHSVRGRVLLLAARHAEAAEASREAIRLSVDHSHAISNLLECCQDNVARREALAFILSELERQVVLGDGLLGYVRAAYPLLEPAELLANLRAAHAARPDMWHAWSALIGQLCDTHHAVEALPLALEAVERFPLNARLWNDLALVHREKRDFKSEIEALRRAFELSPTWGFTARALSEAHQRLEQYDDAQRVLEEAIAASPLEPANYGYLADLLWRRGRSPRVPELLAHAIRIDPTYGWAWDMLRGCSPPSENHAVELARELTQTRGGEADSWLRLAEMLPDDRLDERLAMLDRALELNPRHLRAHDSRAWLLVAAGRYDDAAAACAPAIFANQVPRSLRARAAWVKAARGNLKGALSDMRKIAETEPDFYWAWECIAEWSDKMGEHEITKDAAGRMARLAPRNAIPLGYLADAEFKLGHHDAALAVLQRAFAIDPSYGFAGFTLFNEHLKKKKAEAAQATLDLLKKHLPGADTTAAEVRLLAAKANGDAAISCFSTLLCIPERDSGALNVAATALFDAGWQNSVESLIEKQLADEKLNTTAAVIWVRCFTHRGAWKRRRILYKLDPSRELTLRAWGIFIEECGERKKTEYIRPLLRKHRALLTANTTLWGQIGFAYVHNNRVRDAAKWFANWRERSDIAPWMLINIVITLRSTNRDDEAFEASRRALQLRRDHTSDTHKLWVAIHISQNGDTNGARFLLDELRYDGLDPFNRSQWAVANAVCAVAETAPERRRTAYEEQMQKLRSADYATLRSNESLRRAARRAVTLIARHAGVSMPYLRGRLARFGRRSPARTDAAPLGGNPAMLFVVVIAIVSAMIRACNFQSPPPNFENNIPTKTPEQWKTKNRTEQDVEEGLRRLRDKKRREILKKNLRLDPNSPQE